MARLIVNNTWPSESETSSPPVLPLAGQIIIFLPKFRDGLERLGSSLLDPTHFDPVIVDDFLCAVHEVEVASHRSERRPRLSR